MQGSDCYEKFMGMQECMKQYPALYEEKDGNGDGSQMPGSDPGGSSSETSPDQSVATIDSSSSNESSASASETVSSDITARDGEPSSSQ